VSQRTTVSSRSRTGAAAAASVGAGGAGPSAVRGAVTGGVATAGAGRSGSEERIHSSIARSSPSTHFFRTSVDSFGATCGRRRRARSVRRTVPAHRSTIRSESRDAAPGSPFDGRMRAASSAEMPSPLRVSLESSRAAATLPCPAFTSRSAVSRLTPNERASSSTGAPADVGAGATVSVEPSMGAGYVLAGRGVLISPGADRTFVSTGERPTYPP